MIEEYIFKYFRQLQYQYTLQKNLIRKKLNQRKTQLFERKLNKPNANQYAN